MQLITYSHLLLANIYKLYALFLYRWVLGFHSRNIITSKTMEYYGVDIQHKDHLSKSELKLEAQYEDRLVAEFTRNHLFEGRNPDKLTTFMNNDVVSQAIEDSVLDVFELGIEGVKKFMLTRLVKEEGGNRPAQQFSSRLPKNHSLTFLNLFDVERDASELTEKQVIRVDRSIFKRLITAQLAGRSIDFAEAARYEALSVPISIFKTDKTMRGGTKSTLVTPMLKSAGVDKLSSLPPRTAKESQHAVDCMALVNSITITEKIKTFKHFSDEYNKVLFNMPSDRIDLDCDRYDKPSSKDDVRKGRAVQSGKRSNKKSSKRKKNIKNPVEKVLTPELEFPASEKEFKLFLTVKENKRQLQKLLAEGLLRSAPQNKTIIVSGAFEDPMEVRSNKLLPHEITALECDHEEADTRLALSVIKSPTSRSVVWCSDTDVLITLLANYPRIKDKEVYMRRGKEDFLPINDIARGLIAKGVELKSLPIMHAISGCDTVSFMYGIGKPTAWNTFIDHHVSSFRTQ